MSIVCQINQKYQILNKEIAKNMILNKAELFFNLLTSYLESLNINKVNIIGLGNSISAGWSNFDNDVQPFILKFKNILDNQITKTPIQINFHNYSLISTHSNSNLLKFIQSNPTENDVLKYFYQDKNRWDVENYHSPFQNFVNMKQALQLYPQSDIDFLSNYQNDTLTLTLFNGCSAEIINCLSNLHNIKNILKIINEELDSLALIIQYLKNLNTIDQNIITIGNFPYISTYIGNFLNIFIKNHINNKINNLCLNYNVNYFDKNQMQLLEDFYNPISERKEIKIARHPSIDEQYTILYHYVNYLITLLQRKNTTLIRTK